MDNILNIPGLMPVDLRASQYPVPFDPSWKPTWPTPAPANSALQGSASPLDINALSGFHGDGITPPIGGYGDAQDYGFLSNLPSAGYTPFAPYVNPAQGVTAFGGLGLGNLGQNLSDRVSSLTDAPSNFDSKNILQSLINAGGIFSPLIPAVAGILQGFNLLEPGGTTGSGLADIPGTAGGIQNFTAWGANQLDQLFGGKPMNSSYIDPNMSGPPTPNGDPYGGGPGGYIAPPVMGPDYAAPNPAGPTDPAIPQYQDNMDPGWGGAGSMDAQPMPDQFFQTGGQAFGPGTSVYNSIGLAPWMTGDFGGGSGTFGPWGGASTADNNGGWGQ